jgi:hypothetical protein
MAITLHYLELRLYRLLVSTEYEVLQFKLLPLKTYEGGAPAVGPSRLWKLTLPGLTGWLIIYTFEISTC